MKTLTLIAVALLGAPVLASAQSPLDTVLGLADGRVALHFATRDDVWGDGPSIHVGEPHRARGHWRRGPLHLLLELRHGELVDVDPRIGEPVLAGRAADDVIDLGQLAPEAAATLLLDLAARLPGGEAGALIFPATLARDVETWPRLLEIARDRGLDRDLREQAIFWLGQDAADAATRGLTAIVDDDDADLAVRERAVFALSQRADEEGLPALMQLVRTSPHPQLRETALFWLAQHDDPRVLALFEEILLGE